jgi:hypothetical protein
MGLEQMRTAASKHDVGNVARVGQIVGPLALAMAAVVGLEANLHRLISTVP